MWINKNVMKKKIVLLPAAGFMAARCVAILSSEVHEASAVFMLKLPIKSRIVFCSVLILQLKCATQQPML